MLVVVSSIFLVDTKIIFRYDFIALLNYVLAHSGTFPQIADVTQGITTKQSEVL